MATTRKEALEKEKKAILAKDFVTKNEVLTSDHVEDLFNLFHLYADARTKRADIRDILVTARTLGLNDKYAFVFKALEGVCDGPQGNELDFETFVKDLTAKIVPFRLEFRVHHSVRSAVKPLSICWTCKARKSWNLKTFVTSTTS
jgi:hypothetical protein